MLPHVYKAESDKVRSVKQKGQQLHDSNAHMPWHCTVVNYALNLGPVMVDNMQVFHLIKCRDLETGQLTYFR